MKALIKNRTKQEALTNVGNQLKAGSMTPPEYRAAITYILNHFLKNQKP